MISDQGYPMIERSADTKTSIRMVSIPIRIPQYHRDNVLQLDPSFVSTEFWDETAEYRSCLYPESAWKLREDNCQQLSVTYDPFMFIEPDELPLSELRWLSPDSPEVRSRVNSSQVAQATATCAPAYGNDAEFEYLKEQWYQLRMSVQTSPQSDASTEKPRAEARLNRKRRWIRVHLDCPELNQTWKWNLICREIQQLLWSLDESKRHNMGPITNHPGGDDVDTLTAKPTVCNRAGEVHGAQRMRSVGDVTARCSPTEDSPTSWDSDTDSEYGGNLSDFDQELKPVTSPEWNETHPFFSTKHEIVRMLFDGWEGFRAQISARDKSSSNESAEITRSQQTTSTRASADSCIKRPRGSSDRGGGGSDGEGRKRQRSNRTRSSQLRGRYSLACPFAKKDPKKYRHCYSKIITKIQYVKQHLQRYHQIPLFCPRCKEQFISNDLLVKHGENPVPCTARRADPPDGVTPEQNERLRDRVPSKKPLEEQWYSIFDILFPEYPKPKSIFVDTELEQEMRGFRDFLQARGPSIIVEGLESAGLREASSNEEHDLSTLLRAAAVDIIEKIVGTWTECSDRGIDATTAGLTTSVKDSEIFTEKSGLGMLCPASTHDMGSEKLTEDRGNEGGSYSGHMPTPWSREPPVVSLEESHAKLAHAPQIGPVTEEAVEELSFQAMINFDYDFWNLGNTEDDHGGVGG